MTAAAHELARLIYLTLTKGAEYTHKGQIDCERRCRERGAHSLDRKVSELDLQPVPCPNPARSSPCKSICCGVLLEGRR